MAYIREYLPGEGLNPYPSHSHPYEYEKFKQELPWGASVMNWPFKRWRDIWSVSLLSDWIKLQDFLYWSGRSYSHRPGALSDEHEMSAFTAVHSKLYWPAVPASSVPRLLIVQYYRNHIWSTYRFPPFLFRKPSLFWVLWSLKWTQRRRQNQSRK